MSSAAVPHQYLSIEYTFDHPSFSSDTTFKKMVILTLSFIGEILVVVVQQCGGAGGQCGLRLRPPARNGGQGPEILFQG